MGSWKLNRSLSGIRPPACPLTHNEAMHLPDAIDSVRPAVVQIRVEQRRGESVPIGTGFIITDMGHVLTAKHVVEAVDQLLTQGSRLLCGLAVPSTTGPITIRGSFELVESEVVARDTRHDLALLRMSNNPFESGRTPGIHRTPDGGVAMNAIWGLAALNIDHPRDGESVAVSGYPLSEPAMITTSGHVATAWGLDVQEVHPPGAPDWFSIPDSKDSYLIDVAVNPGNSGGPVFRTYTGEVIAVCVAFQVARASSGPTSVFSYNSGLAVAVPIRYGVELLRASLPTADPSPPDPQAPTTSVP